MLRLKQKTIVSLISSVQVLFSSDGVSAVKSMILLLNINCILYPAGRAKADSGLVLLYKRNTCVDC